MYVLKRRRDWRETRWRRSFLSAAKFPFHSTQLTQQILLDGPVIAPIEHGIDL